MKRTIKIMATDDWKLNDIIDNLIHGEGWKGFFSPMGSKLQECLIEVIIKVKRVNYPRCKQTGHHGS